MTPPRCGCRIEHDTGTFSEPDYKPVIIKCPLCLAAPALVEAVRKIADFKRVPGFPWGCAHAQSMADIAATAQEAG